MIVQKILFAAGLAFALLTTEASAATLASPLSYETHDGKTMRGFIMQNDDVSDDAPVAILMHGMQTHMFHWIADSGPMYGGKLLQTFLDQGYRVVALDARIHGYAKKEGNPETALAKAKIGMTSDYYSMIEDTVKDYEHVLGRIKINFEETSRIIAVGYSMGAQMAIMLAARNPEITHLVTMVPPHTGRLKRVNPVTFAPQVHVKDWLLLMANEDDYTDPDENDEIEAAIQVNYSRVNFESGHVLPESYVDVVNEWISKIDVQ